MPATPSSTKTLYHVLVSRTSAYKRTTLSILTLFLESNNSSSSSSCSSAFL